MLRLLTSVTLLSVLASCSMFTKDHGDNTLLSVPVHNGNYIPVIAWNAENLPPNPQSGPEYTHTVKYYLRGFNSEAQCNGATLNDIKQNHYLIGTVTTHSAHEVDHMNDDRRFENDPLTEGLYYRAVVTVQANQLPNSPTPIRALPLSNCVQAAN